MSGWPVIGQSDEISSHWKVTSVEPGGVALDDVEVVDRVAHLVTEHGIVAESEPARVGGHVGGW